MDRQTAAVYSVLRGREIEAKYTQREAQEMYAKDLSTPGTAAYRQRECSERVSNAISHCYCGPNDTKSGKAARVLCSLSVASTAIGLCGVMMNIQPGAAAAIAYTGMAGCGITPCVGHSGNSKCCSTEEPSSSVQDQSVIMMQPQVSTSVVTVQPSSSMQQASTSSVVAQVHRK